MAWIAEKFPWILDHRSCWRFLKEGIPLHCITEGFIQRVKPNLKKETKLKANNSPLRGVSTNLSAATASSVNPSFPGLSDAFNAWYTTCLQGMENSLNRIT
jgi:hypothetical protein